MREENSGRENREPEKGKSRQTDTGDETKEGEKEARHEILSGYRVLVW